MALIAGLQFAPPGLMADIFVGVQPERSLACLQQFGVALGCFLLMRSLAAATIFCSRRWLDPAEARDAYILLVNPNFFLWAALFGGVTVAHHQDVLDYGRFWGACGFFCVPVIEQLFFTNTFSSDLLKEALQSTRFPTSEAQHLFQQLDRDGNRSLDKGELVELLRSIEDRTTGQRNGEDIRAYLADRFFETLDPSQSGSIDFDKFANYLAKYGMVIDLNIER